MGLTIVHIQSGGGLFGSDYYDHHALSSVLMPSTHQGGAGTLFPCLGCMVIDFRGTVNALAAVGKVQIMMMRIKQASASRERHI